VIADIARDRKTKTLPLINTDDTDRKNPQPGGAGPRDFFLSRDVQAGFARDWKCKVPETRVKPASQPILVTRCIGIDDVGEGKGLGL